MRKWRKERDRGPAVVSKLRRATVLPPWMAESSPDEPDDAEPCYFLKLPQELQLAIFPFVDDWTDAANLCLALPRLGVLAIRGQLEWQGPLFAIAMWLASSRYSGPRYQIIDERLFRKYANDPKADAADFEWLKKANAAAGSVLHLESSVERNVRDGDICWRLCKGSAGKVLIRVNRVASGIEHFYEGGVGAERLVRKEYYSHEGEKISDAYYEGEKGNERLVVRVTGIDGDGKELNYEYHYTGERNAEQLVRVVRSDGAVDHYEGQSGLERCVRMESPGGDEVHFYEGEKDAERLVRVEFANGAVSYFEGETGAERMVRTWLLDDAVSYYEGEKNAERRVRREYPSGRVEFFEGEHGAERVVHIEHPDGRVEHL